MSARETYRADVDGLRALAVLLVIAYHAKLSGIAHGGFVGVDVFYVISGFLITRLLSTEMIATGTISFGSFYARRVRRLVPAFSAVIVATVALWAIFLKGVPAETARLVESVRYSAFGLANIYFKNNSGGYFDGASDEMPLLHFWSLGVEEQFYLVWPILLLLTQVDLLFLSQTDFGRRRNKLENYGDRLTLLLLAAVAASLLCSNVLLNRRENSAAFYWMPARAWELALGGLLFSTSARFTAFLERRGGFFRKIASEGAATLGIFLIVFAGCIFADETRNPVVNAVFATLGAALVIFAGSTANRPAWPNRVLSWRPIVHIGLISYGWYLWHWPLLALAKVWNYGEVPSLAVRATAILASGLLAELSLRYLETPFRKGMKWLPTRRVIAFGLAAAASVVVLAGAVGALENHFQSQRWLAFQKLIDERSPVVASCGDKISDVGSEGCSVSFSPPGTRSASTIAVWGNSHAFAIFPMVEEYAREKRLTAALYSKPGPIPSIVYPENFSTGAVYGGRTEDFRAYTDAVIGDLRRRIEEHPGTRISVLLASRWMGALGIPYMSGETTSLYLDSARSHSGSLAIIRDGLRMTLRKLSDIGVSRVLILLPYPEFSHTSPRCFARNPRVCATVTRRMEDYRAEVVAAIREGMRGFTFAKTIDPLQSLCTGGTCPQFMPLNGAEIPVVYDHDHPTAVAARFLAARLRNELGWLTTN
jgi:peptidoglycan/LPS O-acetylase OafA/YrhL